MTTKTGTHAISEDSVRDKTGHGWDHWFKILDAFDVVKHGHSKAAAHLVDAHGVSGWWAQSISVRYEQERGLRDVGQQGDKLYAVSVQRTFDAPVARVWRALTDLAERRQWGGEGDHPPVVEGGTFTGADGSSGKFLNVVPNARIRHTWQRPGCQPEQIEWTLTPKGDKTTVRFQHTKIVEKAAADQFKPMWTKAVEGLRDYVARG